MNKSPINITYKDYSLETSDRALGKSKIIKAQFELTYGCNLHCLHCYTDPLNRPDLLKKELPFEDIIQALDKLHDEGVLWLCFTGGEIFMRRDFLKIYKYAFNKGFILTLFTNGTLITKEVVECFKESPPFSIEITLLGANPETFDKISQIPGSFKKCIDGIKTLKENNLPVKLKTPLLRENIEEMYQIKKLTEELGMKFKLNSTVFPRLDGDASSLNHRLTPEEIIELEFDIGPYKDEKPDPEASCNSFQDEEASETNPKKYRCGCGKERFHLDPYGNVGACTWQRKNRYSFKEGNLNENMAHLAHKITTDEYSEESACRDCQVYAFCEKMPEAAAHEVPNAEEPIDYYCDIAFGRRDKLKSKLT